MYSEFSGITHTYDLCYLNETTSVLILRNLKCSWANKNPKKELWQIPTGMDTTVKNFLKNMGKVGLAL